MYKVCVVNYDIKYFEVFIFVRVRRYWFVCYMSLSTFSLGVLESWEITILYIRLLNFSLNGPASVCDSKKDWRPIVVVKLTYVHHIVILHQTFPTVCVC